MTSLPRSLLASLCLAIWAAPALAQQQAVSIRGGEHPTYSRLVIPSANANPWELRTSGRESTLVLLGTEREYLADRIFDRVSRTRILDAKTVSTDEGTELNLRLGCDCIVTAEIDGQSIILDIKENAPETASKPDTADPAANSEEETPRPLARPETSAESEDGKTAEQEPDAGFDLAEQLLTQLNRAAEQGIIELQEEPPSGGPETEEQAPQSAPEDPAPQEPETPAPLLQPIEENIDGLEGVATRMERELEALSDLGELESSVRISIPQERKVESDIPSIARPELPTQDVAAEPDHCIDDEFLDIAYWADARPYPEQFAALQSRVFGEFDKPDSESVLELSRFYLFFGLGTEARSLLSDLNPDTFQTELLSELAGTVEGRPHVAGGLLDKAAGCPGAVSLWRTAAIDDAESQPVSNADEIINIFAEYPIEVRRILGPRLVQSFLLRGQNDVATRIFSIVERAAGYHGDWHELRRADLLIIDGNPENAEEIYWQLVYANTDVSPEAASSLVQSRLDRGLKVPPNVISTLETMSVELRGSAIGADLLLLAIRSKAGSNRLEDALQIANEELEAAAEPGAYRDAIDAILASARTDQLGATTYAQLVFKNMDHVLGQTTKASTKQTIAEEMLTAGLPNAALEIIDQIEAPSSPEVSNLKTRAFLKLGDLEAALKESQTAEKTQEYRVQALSRLGRHETALRTAQAAATLENTPTLAWRAGDWETASTSDQIHIQALSQFMLHEDDGGKQSDELDLASAERAVAQRAADEEELSLKYARRVQEQSSLIRDFLSDVLTDM